MVWFLKFVDPVGSASNYINNGEKIPAGFQLNFDAEYAYKLTKHILKNQLVLTFHHRVTATFINFTIDLHNHIGAFNSPLLQETRQVAPFTPSVHVTGNP